MRKKLSLELEALAVSSFDTSPQGAERAGTVRGFASEGDDIPQPTPPVYYDDKCTCAGSCPCPSAYYYCGDGYHTLYSCKYTQNASCIVTP